MSDNSHKSLQLTDVKIDERSLFPLDFGTDSVIAKKYLKEWGEFG